MARKKSILSRAATLLARGIVPAEMAEGKRAGNLAAES
jgi:hypothetical protein